MKIVRSSVRCGGSGAGRGHDVGASVVACAPCEVYRGALRLGTVLEGDRCGVRSVQRGAGGNVSASDGRAHVFLPDFMIIGAQRAGTTWLYKNLREHPGVYMPAKKELEFFSHKARLARGLRFVRVAIRRRSVGCKNRGGDTLVPVDTVQREPVGAIPVPFVAGHTGAGPRSAGSGHEDTGEPARPGRPGRVRLPLARPLRPRRARPRPDRGRRPGGHRPHGISTRSTSGPWLELFGANVLVLIQEETELDPAGVLDSCL